MFLVECTEPLRQYDYRKIDDIICHHSLFRSNHFGDLERYLLRPGKVHSAEDWWLVFEPVATMKLMAKNGFHD